MPKPRMNICSFYVHRPDEHPDAADYVEMLGWLQLSCDRLNLRHVVLTDHISAGRLPQRMERHVSVLPMPLMQAVTWAQSHWLETGEWNNADTLLVGADCVMLRHPGKTYPGDNKADLCVTFRPGHKRYPINTGAIMVRRQARARAIRLFGNINALTGAKWGDDQRAIEAALFPMPKTWGIHERAGLRVAFLPMKGFNDVPQSPADRMSGATMLHFRGKARKELMGNWCRVNLNG